MNINLSVDELEILDDLVKELNDLPGDDCTRETALHYLIYYYKAHQVARSNNNEVA